VRFVCDTTCSEGAPKVRTDDGPDNMGSLRNLAINTLQTDAACAVVHRRAEQVQSDEGVPPQAMAVILPTGPPDQPTRTESLAA
jgi:hypothetical protein